MKADWWQSSTTSEHTPAQIAEESSFYPEEPHGNHYQSVLCITNFPAQAPKHFQFIITKIMQWSRSITTKFFFTPHDKICAEFIEKLCQAKPFNIHVMIFAHANKKRRLTIKWSDCFGHRNFTCILYGTRWVRLLLLRSNPPPPTHTLSNSSRSLKKPLVSFRVKRAASSGPRLIYNCLTSACVAAWIC